MNCRNCGASLEHPPLDLFLVFFAGLLCPCPYHKWFAPCEYCLDDDSVFDRQYFEFVVKTYTTKPRPSDLKWPDLRGTPYISNTTTSNT